MKSFIALALSVFALTEVSGHGRLLCPPHRGYIGKVSGYSKIPIDYSDHGLNGGGIEQTKGGKHGVCGDPYSASGVGPHETGGMYGLFPKLGKEAIGACYNPGQSIDFQVQITANHKGYFKFGLCKLKNKDDKETEECFTDLKQPNGQQQWDIPAGAQTFTMQYKLPNDVECDGDSHCVLRWWYVGGNNPGADMNGQEQFWNCADIYISNSCSVKSTCPSSGGNNGPSPATPSTPSATNSSTPITPTNSSATPSSKTPSTYTPPSNPTTVPSTPATKKSICKPKKLRL